MKKRPKLILLLALLLIGAAALGWWSLPHVVAALPGQVRVRLPRELVELVTTPLPTALPAPETAVSANPRPTLLLLSSPTATATPTTAPSPTPGAAATTPTPPTPTPTAIPTATPLPYPPSARLNGLTLTPQKLNNCGPTNLAITLSFHGHETSQFDVAGVVKPNYEDRNVSPEELAAYVNEQTPLKASVYRGGDLDLLKQFIAAGFPVIIEKGLDDPHDGWMGHYLTVFGYDERTRQFVSMDTLLGPWDGTGRFDSYESIDRYWQQFNYTFILVYPAARETAVSHLLPPDLREPQAMWQHAARRAQQQLDAQPDNAFLWFALGGSLVHLGQVTGEERYGETAVSAFDRARQLGLPPRMVWYQFEIYEAYLGNGRIQDVLTLTDAILESQGGRNVEETYLYRGHALRAQGHSDEAAAAYRRALRLKPHFGAAQEALAAVQE